MEIMPTFKGVKCRLAPHLGYRDTDPNRDIDTDGKKVAYHHHAAIVRLKDCRLYEKDGRKYYDPKDASAIPTSHGSTWYSYGKSRKRNEGRYFWTNDNEKLIWLDEYYTTPFYVVRDGRVYQGTIRRPYPSISCFMQQGINYKQAREKYIAAKEHFNSLEGVPREQVEQWL